MLFHKKKVWIPKHNESLFADISKKQIFAYFHYLTCLNKVSQSLNFRIPYRGKVSKFITIDYIFPDKNFNPILSNLSFSVPAYHVSFNLISSAIDITSANINIFDDLAILVMSKDFLIWKWRDFMTWFCLCCNTIIGSSCQHFSNAVDMKAWNHMAM